MPSSRHREEGNVGVPPEKPHDVLRSAPILRGDPPDPADPVDVRLFRTEDLVVAQLRAPGCHVEPGAGGPELVADTDPASLVLELPPQHLGEHAWLETETPSGLAAHRAAAPSRTPIGASPSSSSRRAPTTPVPRPERCISSSRTAS